MSLPLDYAGSGLPTSPYPEYKHPFMVLAYDDLLEDNERRDYSINPPRLLKKRDVQQSGMKGKPIDIQHRESDKVGIFHDYKITGKNLWARGYANDRGRQWIKENESMPDPIKPGHIHKRRVGFSISFDSPPVEYADENVLCDVAGGAFCVDPVRMKCFVRTDYSRGSNDDDLITEDVETETQKNEKIIKKKIRFQFSTQAQVEFVTLDQMNTPSVTDTSTVDSKTAPVSVPIDPNTPGEQKPDTTPKAVDVPPKATDTTPPATTTEMSAPMFDFTKPDETKKAQEEYYSKLSPDLQKVYMKQLFDVSLSGAKMQHEQGIKEKASHMELLKGLSTELPDWNEAEYAKEYDNGVRHERVIKMAQSQRTKMEEFKKKEKEAQSQDRKNGKQPSSSNNNTTTPPSKNTSQPVDQNTLNRKQNEISTMFQNMLKSRTPQPKVPESKYFPTPQAVRNHYSNDRNPEEVVVDKEPKAPEKRERDDSSDKDKNTKGPTVRMMFGNNGRLEQIMNAEIDMFNMGVDNKKQFHELWHDIKITYDIASKTGRDDLDEIASAKNSRGGGTDRKHSDLFNTSNFIEG
jgi:hypothetical protein